MTLYKSTIFQLAAALFRFCILVTGLVIGFVLFAHLYQSMAGPVTLRFLLEAF